MTAHTAFLFPGQGSQSVGMGKEFLAVSATARARLEEASGVLGFDLGALILEGPEEALNRTANTQPALFTLSAIALDQLREARPGLVPVAVAGHSLGEFSACYAAGAFTFADGVRMVRTRGELMQSAVPVGEGGMAAVIGLTSDEISAALQGFDGEVFAANFNSPEQTVVAGMSADLARFLPYIKDKGAKKAVPLSVSAPFHTTYMRTAREGLAAFMESVAFADPSIPVVRNVDAGVSRTAADVKEGLIAQVTGCVRWVDGMKRLAAMGVTSAVEVGPGRVLAGLMKRIEKNIPVGFAATPGDIAAIEESAHAPA
ncbi:MAG: ACP S-malonyltransferase [Nitrospinae bacterium]|nr:ACP S-malonyltransferase [Nitrospinota bacterium]